MRAVILAAACGACATTTSVCPIGTQRVDVRNEQNRAQFCTTADPRLATVPFAGRDYTSAIGSHPPPMTGGVNGPFTSWYASGAIESHGHYVDFGARSVPDGLWAFWYANGSRRTFGMYHRGEPTGCFAVWDETGARKTGFVEGDQLRVEACTPPPDDELAIVEGHASEPAAGTAWGDISLQGFFGPGPLGASNELQIDREPSLQAALNATARKRLGRFRFGPTAAIRVSGNTDYRGLGAGGVFAVALPRLHPRLDADVGIEVGAQYITGVAIRPMQPGTADMSFWSPLAAMQLAVGFALSPYLEAVAAARIDGFPARDVERDVMYCANGACLPPQQETWRVGGFSYGLSLGVRLVIR